MKIDRCFVSRISHEQEGTVVQSMLRDGRTMGLEVVAEGIETQGAAAALRAAAACWARASTSHDQCPPTPCPDPGRRAGCRSLGGAWWHCPHGAHDAPAARAPRLLGCAAMKIGEWDNIGKARGLIQRQLGELGADEYAAHVGVNRTTGGCASSWRPTPACSTQLLPGRGRSDGDSILRGQVHRWASIRGLRLQTDAQLVEPEGKMQAVGGWWPRIRIDLMATTDTGEGTIEALLAFARSCLQHAG